MEQIPKNRNIQTHTLHWQKSKLSKEQDQQIKDTIAETPDITLLELIDKLSLDLTEGGLSFHLKAMGLTFKKRHSMQMVKNERI
jgi:transposase